MSFAGIRQFDRNLRALMDSEAFKRAKPGDRIEMGGALLRSRYGAAAPFGDVQELRPKKEKA